EGAPQRRRSLLWLRLGGIAGLPAATGADVLVDIVLYDEGRRRPVVELLAPVRANVDAQPSVALADALGLGQLVVPGLAREGLWHSAAPVRPASPPELRRFLWLGGLCGRLLARGRLREQHQLLGVDALAARPVQAAQQ